MCVPLPPLSDTALPPDDVEIWNVVAGCVGSVVGNLIANQFGIVGSVKEFSITGLVVAFVGAVIVLGILNMVQRGKVR